MKSRWCYLYRAIDSTGATIDFLLSAKRDANAAKRLVRKALSVASHPQPRVINTDLAPKPHCCKFNSSWHAGPQILHFRR